MTERPGQAEDHHRKEGGQEEARGAHPAGDHDMDLPEGVMLHKSMRAYLYYHFRQFLSRSRRSPRVRQVAMLYAANFFGIPLALVTSIVFTRFLGPRAYGDFAFLDSIFEFGKIIFTFGFFYSGSRAIVLNHRLQRTREYYGASLVVLLVLFLVMSVFFVGYGLLDNNLENKGLTRFFLMLVPFGWIFLLMPYFDTLLKADNRIRALSASRFMPKVVLFAGALGVYFFLGDFQGSRLGVVWGLYLTAFFVVYAAILLRIRVSFHSLRRRIRELWMYNRKFGVHIYTGGLFYAGSLSLTTIMVSYFSPDNSGVGFLALALAITRVLELLPTAIATAYFRDFATQQSLSRTLLFITVMLALGGLALTWVLIGPFIRLFYSEDFVPVIALVFPVSAAMLMHGMAGFLNRFLEARGQGKAIRNTYVITGVTLVASSLLLIPSGLEAGAATALLISGVVYLAVMTVYYKKR
jgi:O-antigen/teichoic acid export membrane protein